VSSDEESIDNFEVHKLNHGELDNVLHTYEEAAAIRYSNLENINLIVTRLMNKACLDKAVQTESHQDDPNSSLSSFKPNAILSGDQSVQVLN
jgi:hypothetical protein